MCHDLVTGYRQCGCPHAHVEDGVVDYFETGVYPHRPWAGVQGEFRWREPPF